MKIDEKGFSNFVYLSSPTIDDDGKKIGYVMTKANVEKDEYERFGVVQDLESETVLYVEGASALRVSHSGKWVAFLKKGDGEKTALWVSDSRTVSGRKLVEDENITDISWSRDDSMILLTMRKKSKDEHVFFVGDVPPWFDGRGFLGGERTLFRILDVGSGSILGEVDSNPFSEAIWCGDEILINEPRIRESLWARHDVEIFDPETGELKTLFENWDFRVLQCSNGKFLLHGKQGIKRMSEHRYIYFMENGDVRPLTERLVYNNVNGKLDRNGALYFTSDERGSVVLKVLKGGDVEYVSKDAWVVDFAVSGNGKVVFVQQDEKNPGEVYLYDGIDVKKITSYNDRIVERMNLKEAKHFRFRSLDLEIDGWYIKPDVKNEEKAPVILFVHGGPKGMYGHRFDYTMQYLVSKGFYVVFFNPRGSTGYDEDFALRVLGKTGKEDFQDIMNGLEKFFEIEKGADPDRVGITGISYGGFMTNWAITQTNRFKAAVSENGVSNWINMYGVSDISLVFVKEVIGDDPLENDLHRELSPVFHAKNVETPILLVHSLEDYRCPIDQSVMFYNVLKDLGKEAYLAVFKKGAHGHSLYGKPKHRAKRYRLIRDFFYRKLVEGGEGFEFGSDGSPAERD